MHRAAELAASCGSDPLLGRHVNGLASAVGGVDDDDLGAVRKHGAVTSCALAGIVDVFEQIQGLNRSGRAESRQLGFCALQHRKKSRTRFRFAQLGQDMTSLGVYEEMEAPSVPSPIVQSAE